MTEELHGALQPMHNCMCNVQCIYRQNDCSHNMAVVGKMLMAFICCLNFIFNLSFSAERQCQTGLTCTNGGCVRIPSNGSEVCECNSGYELSDSDSTLCIGKCKHISLYLIYQ